MSQDKQISDTAQTPSPQLGGSQDGMVLVRLERSSLLESHAVVVVGTEGRHYISHEQIEKYAREVLGLMDDEEAQERNQEAGADLAEAERECYE